MKEYVLKSERVKKLRESALSKFPGVSVERGRLLTKAYKEHAGKSKYIVRAYAVKEILENMTIYIKDGELIVGNQSVDERTAPFFPEYAVDWIADELKEKGNFDSRNGDKFRIPEEEIPEMLEICEWWKGKTLKDKAHAQMPKEIKEAGTVKIIHGEGNMTSGDGHIVPSFEKVLEKGLRGIIEEARESREKVDITVYGGYNKVDFLKSVEIVAEAVINFAHRYADLALKLAQTEKDDTRKKELLQIYENCMNVPENPAKTFWEGVQAIWFVHLVIQIESNGHSASLGRVDQYLYSLYKKDVLEGNTDREFAKEMLQCLWVKLYSVIKVRSTSHSGYGAGYPTYQNVTLGGSKPNGKDCTNELSYLILESVGENKLTQPNLAVRYHANSPEKFIRECASVAATGYGMPAMHTDEIIIPALLNKGVDFRDAYNYTMVGCVEVAVPGKWGYRCTGMTFLNLVKATELVLNDGYDNRTGLQMLKGQGKLTDFETYDDLWKAWENHIKHYTKLTVALDALADTHLEEFPDILLSSLVDSCIERGLTAKEGGAVYDIVSGLQVGIANAANSLYALKTVVYDNKILTREEVYNALQNDYAGEEGERIRKILLEVPKYGNDIDEVDEFAEKVYWSYINEIQKYHNTRYGRGPKNGGYGVSTSGISSNVPMGTVSGATPDGRKAYTPAAEGGSPTQGTDTNGPTAVLNSVNKLPTMMITGGQLLNQKYSPELVRTPVQFEKFVDVIKSFIASKGWHIQFNIISSDTLKEAQVEPEKHRDIIVRVAGYCAQFVTLDKTTQCDIISRTEQRL
ncbi:glycyl radical protein [Pseudoleptotrichia goodfellowii]|uniref:Formate C-acetyltransferase n=1 Tax=Pseudoleptotrichia goodfellowii F0264 TaxID=596323 RepID=D0GN72_9FUSO|nr:glycyl radical protein [Pseudoleptotrichia goodfellowii]EEY34475.1 formate C-acetyltransferase [Pseudoleptotrichia goodfellowii F0264]